MLYLTRRIGESIHIGDEINFTILSINGNQVRLGFNAPKHIAIHREEVYLQIQREKNEKRNQNIMISSALSQNKQRAVTH